MIGAVGAIEYMFIKELNLYRHLIPGLLAAAVGYSVYAAILQDSFLGIYSFPDYASPRLIDMWWALLVGIIAGFVGIMFKLVFGIIQRVFAPLAKRPVSRAIIGGIVIGLIGTFLPLTLYSGQNQLLQIIHNPAAFGIGLLLIMVVVKALLTTTSLTTGFEGGPIFPLFFIGGCLGLALSKGLTFIPEGIGVTVGMAAVACAVFPLPLTVALLLGLMGGQTDLLPVIVIGAVTGFVISKVITPYFQNLIQRLQVTKERNSKHQNDFFLWHRIKLLYLIEVNGTIDLSSYAENSASSNSNDEWDIVVFFDRSLSKQNQ